MKLIPLSEYVEKEYSKSVPPETAIDELAASMRRVINYTKFLRQPLTLGMFVATDENGIVYKYPEENQEYLNEISKVCFQGFSVVRSHIEVSKHTLFLKDPKGDWIGHKHDWENHWDIYGKTVEDFCESEYELTPSALKLIGEKE
ncbi:hypothetical protein [uncultured Chryseobacterium sp.]|uniref:hypothetical protein n=1 Tax=uncultured Chryseobacterium sp. TaxID=259322 RepID=UPI002600AD41|nr:hypothetical protein [uncultured Chryseobacterium sp.]